MHRYTYSQMHDSDSIPRPRDFGFTIYSRSGCPYCDLAKELLEFESMTAINCDDFLASDRDGFLETMRLYCGRDYKMFPMIFHNGVFLGGYTDTKDFYQNRLVEMLDEF